MAWGLGAISCAPRSPPPTTPILKVGSAWSSADHGGPSSRHGERPVPNADREAREIGEPLQFQVGPGYSGPPSIALCPDIRFGVHPCQIGVETYDVRVLVLGLLRVGLPVDGVDRQRDASGDAAPP